MDSVCSREDQWHCWRNLQSTLVNEISALQYKYGDIREDPLWVVDSFCACISHLVNGGLEVNLAVKRTVWTGWYLWRKLERTGLGCHVQLPGLYDPQRPARLPRIIRRLREFLGDDISSLHHTAFSERLHFYLFLITLLQDNLLPLLTEISQRPAPHFHTPEWFMRLGV